MLSFGRNKEKRVKFDLSGRYQIHDTELKISQLPGPRSRFSVSFLCQKREKSISLSTSLYDGSTLDNMADYLSVSQDCLLTLVQLTVVLHSAESSDNRSVPAIF